MFKWVVRAALGPKEVSGERAGVTEALWRAVGAFRAVGVIYAILLAVFHQEHWVNPILGWVLLVGMVAWSVLVTVRIARHRVTWPIAVADVLVACLLVFATLLVDDLGMIRSGAPTLPGIWVATPVALLAVWRGPWWGLAAGSVVGAADLIERGAWAASTVNGVLMLLAVGFLVGYVGRVTVQAEEALTSARSERAILAERERLGREIHDTVLQALALVVRRGREIGGPTTELAETASAAEVSLRALVSGVPALTQEAGEEDLAALLRGLAKPSVTVSAPGERVLLEASRAREVQMVVRELLGNVVKHAGADAQAFVLLEDEGEVLRVSVRDDGVGMDPARMQEAEDQGRMGLARSVRGRVEALGGAVSVFTSPGDGCEVEFELRR